MSTYQERFEEEIKRIGGVSEVSRVTGVVRNTVYGWIANANVPLNRLVQLQGLGLDVQYVLNGVRSAARQESEKESAVMRGDVRAAVEGLAEWLQMHQHSLPPAKFAEAVLLIIDVMGAGGTERAAATARVMRLVT